MEAMNTHATPTAPEAARGFALDAHAIRRLMPHRHHMSLLDRVVAYYPEARRMVGIKHVSQNDPIVQGHFPDWPVFPGSLLIEALAQSAGLLMNIEKVRESGIDVASLAAPGGGGGALDIPMTVLVESRIRQHAILVPGDQAELRARVVLRHGTMCHFEVSARVDGRLVADGEILLAFPPYAD